MPPNKYHLRSNKDSLSDELECVLNKSRNKKKQPKGKGVFECGICGKKFAYKVNLKVHINAVHMVRKYSCKYCGKTYSRLQTLKGHIKVYHEGLHFKCSKPNCNESFQRKDQLKAHMMSHQGNQSQITRHTATLISSTNHTNVVNGTHIQQTTLLISRGI